MGRITIFLIIFIGIPTVYLYNIVAGVIRATGDSKTPVVFLVLSSVINIVLDLYFISIPATWAWRGQPGQR